MVRSRLVGIWITILSCTSAWAQTTVRVSLDSAGAQVAGHSLVASISVDGRYVAFLSHSSELVPGDSNNAPDVFLHDQQAGTTTRISVDSNGLQGNDGSSSPSISADGRYVAFASTASNLVPGDMNGHGDVFVHDNQSGQTQCVSIDAGGYEGNGDSKLCAISADGRYVVFMSYAYTLWSGDANGGSDVFVRDLLMGTTDLVSVSSNGTQGNDNSGWLSAPAISADGRYVAFESFAANFASGDTNGTLDIFVHDRQTGITIRVSEGASGAQADAASEHPSLSADGRWVAFQSDANTLVPGDAFNTDIFVRDLLVGTIARISVGSGSGGGPSRAPSFSPDGRYVAFESSAANLVPGDTNGVSDAFVYDLVMSLTQRVSISSTGFEGNLGSGAPVASFDGRFVAFPSSATNLVAGDTNVSDDIFLIDRTCTGAISTYCTAKTNSLGCLPSIGSIGLPSQSGMDNFYVTASNVLNNKLGMMLWSLAPANNPFGGGTLCLLQPIVRTPAQNSGGSTSGTDCTGTYSYHFSQSYMIQQLLAANTTIYAQYWSRDPGFVIPNNIGLTNGLRFTICP